MRATYEKFAPLTKCRACGWDTERLYFLGPIQEDSVGMCADCFAECIVDMEYDIRGVKA